MASVTFFNTHRTWEDWLGIVLGVIIGMTTWLADAAVSTIVMQLTMLIGICVLVLSAFEFVHLHRFEEVGLMLLGAGLVVMPFLFGYADSGSLRIWHFGLGAITAVIGALELWQDWKRSRQQLAHHGE